MNCTWMILRKERIHSILQKWPTVVQIASAARNGINDVPHAAVTNFAFSSVFFLLLWWMGSIWPFTTKVYCKKVAKLYFVLSFLRLFVRMSKRAVQSFLQKHQRGYGPKNPELGRFVHVGGGKFCLLIFRILCHDPLTSFPVISCSNKK